MTGQILEIATDNKHLSAKDGFIVISEGQVELGRIPIDAVEAVVVSAHGITYSHSFLVRLSENNIPFVACNQKHFPVSYLLPFEGHYNQGSVMDAQLQANVPLNKRLWRDLVKAKIAMQISVLTHYQKPVQRLEYLLKSVKSDDSENAEGQAARFYFQALFGDNFIRDREADGINAMLNYGYTVLRAFIARYSTAAGLHPTMGIHHRNALNGFRLADDLMEPFRPIVDFAVYEMITKGETALTSTVKQSLVNVFSGNIPAFLGQTQITICMQNLCISLAKVYLKEREELDLPYSPQPWDWEALNAFIAV